MKLIGHFAYADASAPVGAKVTTLCGKTSRKRDGTPPALVTCTACANAALKDAGKRVTHYRWTGRAGTATTT